MVGTMGMTWEQRDKRNTRGVSPTGEASINLTVRTHNYTLGYTRSTNKRIVGRQTARIFFVTTRRDGGEWTNVGYAFSMREAKAMAAKALAE